VRCASRRFSLVSAWGISAKSWFLLLGCFGVISTNIWLSSWYVMAVNCTVAAVLMKGAPWQRVPLLREQEVAEEERRADAGANHAPDLGPQEPPHD
jgi:hypothetical protein